MAMVPTVILTPTRKPESDSKTASRLSAVFFSGVLGVAGTG